MHPAAPLQPTWTTPVYAFVDDNCGIFQADGGSAGSGGGSGSGSGGRAERHDTYSRFRALVEPLLAQHLQGARITDVEFRRIVAHTKDNPELSDVVPPHVTSLTDYSAFTRVRGGMEAGSGWTLALPRFIHVRMRLAPPSSARPPSHCR